VGASGCGSGVSCEGCGSRLGSSDNVSGVGVLGFLTADFLFILTSKDFVNQYDCGVKINNRK
jgi:hypothetical protein